MSKRTQAAFSIAFLLVAFVAVNVLAGALFRSSRLDLTANHLYTVSPGTKAMLKKLTEPVTLRFYFSERLAADYQSISAYGIRVRDLLRELVQNARGKLLLEVVDPEPYSPEEEFAESYGLTGAQTQSGEKLFLGLVGTNLVDGQETIPFFAPEREEHLEYDIAALIHSLSTPEKPKLGLISSLPLETGAGGLMAAMSGQPTHPYVIYEQLKKTFDVQMLQDDIKTVPSDIGAVMIAHPGALKPRALYAIDQFAMRGGRLLVFVDPFAEAAAGAGGMPGGPAQSSDLSPLLAAWGVEYDSQQVVLDRSRATLVQYGGVQPVPYVAWLGLQGDDLNRSDLVTSDIETIRFASGGHLEPAAGATTKLQALLRSSAESQTAPSMMLAMGGDPPTLLEQFKSGGKRLTLAARVSGPVKSAFPSGPPPAQAPNPDAGAEPQKPEEPLPAHIPQSKAPLNLIVVADSDMLDDRFWVQTQTFLGQRIAQATAGNGYFVINAVDNLLGSGDLISLRSREKSDRPFKVVQAIERRAQDQYRAEEERLRAEIEQTEQRLATLQGTKKGAEALSDDPRGAALSPEEAKEVRRFQAQLAESRRALREVQRKLRADVTRLGGWVKLVNIALMPLAVAGFAVGLAVVRRRRRKQAVMAGAPRAAGAVA